MNWQSLDQFLHMGGYGLYVWGSYAVTFAVLGLEVLVLRGRQRRAWADARDDATQGAGQ